MAPEGRAVFHAQLAGRVCDTALSHSRANWLGRSTAVPFEDMFLVHACRLHTPLPESQMKSTWMSWLQAFFMGN